MILSIFRFVVPDCLLKQLMDQYLQLRKKVLHQILLKKRGKLSFIKKRKGKLLVNFLSK